MSEPVFDPNAPSQTVDEVAEQNDKPIAAGLAGAARGATFGLSDLALTKTGLVEPETLQNLKKYNPNASAVGEVAGAVAPALIPGVGEFTAGGLAAKAGGAAGNLVSDTIGNAVAKKVLGKAVEGATEGALFSTGGVLSEKTLGDPNLTGEVAFQHIMQGAALGGLAGAAVGSIGSGLDKFKEAVGSGDEAISKIQDKATKIYSKAKEATSDVDAEAINDVLANRLKTVQNSPAQRAEFIDHLFEAATNKNVKNLAELIESEPSLAANKDLQDAVKAYQSKASELGDLINAKQATPNGNVVEVPNHDMFTSLIDGAHKKNGHGDLLGEFYFEQNRLLNEANKISGLEQELPGDLGGTFRSLRSDNVIKDALEQKPSLGVSDFLASHVPVVGKPYVAGKYAYQTAANPLEFMKVLDTLDAVKSIFNKRFSTQVGRLVDGASDIASKTPKLGIPSMVTANNFTDHLNNLTTLASSPDVLMDNLSQHTDRLQAAPETSQAVATVASRAVGYLNQFVPKDPGNTNPLNPMQSTWKPSRTQLASYNRRVVAVSNPFTVLQNPTQEGVDTLKTVYPQIYQQARQQVADQIAQKKNIPYQTKARLALLFGLTTDSLMERPNVNVLQSNFAAPSQEKPQGPAPKHALNVAKIEEDSLDAVENF